MPKTTTSTRTSAKPRNAQARGLPDSFGLDAGAIGGLNRKPIAIGDYLDEPATPVAGPTAAPAAGGESMLQKVAGDGGERGDRREHAATAEPSKPSEKDGPAPTPAPSGTATVPTTKLTRRRATALTPSLPAAARSKHTRSGPPRKQINMRPETLDKAQELLFLVQQFGPQFDTKASEVFEALVDLLHESRRHLDFSDVPLRGKWGEPSARAYPQHLKAAFAEAIRRAAESGVVELPMQPEPPADAATREAA